ncbi:glycosyltransferase domain-containing protein [Microbulbifer epialgicus]|uniref:Glycosyltransferase domain-containing protein n=1 Tax=Microbulbifer epialgicus TaxID=393907 RepID=A0ABV4NZX5_9GAMM
MFPVLQESAKRNGVHLNILGRNYPWQNFSSKIDLLIPFIQQLPEEDIICYLDGFDSLILPSIHQLEDKFHAYDKEIVFSNDHQHNGTQGFFERKHFAGTDIFSTGIFIGKVKTINHLFSAIKKMYPDYSDDQKMIRRYYTQYSPEHIGIDSEFKLFYNFDVADSSFNLLNQIDTISQGKIYLSNRETPAIISFPCSWFAIGITKNIHTLLKKLGYNYYPEVNIKKTFIGLKYYIGTTIKDSIKALLK